MAKKKTTEEFRKEVEILTKKEYSLHPNSIYINDETKIDIIHNIDGQILHITPHAFLRKKICRENKRLLKIKPDNKREKFLNKKHKELQEKMTKKGILLASGYLGVDQPIDFMCLRCGDTNTSTPYRLEKHGCAYCAGKKHYTTEDIKKIIPKIDKEYILHPDYVYTNKFRKLKLIHLPCGNIYEVTLSNFRNRGNRCTFCKFDESRDIIRIKELLENNNIKFDTEVTFEDLKYKGKLRFDLIIDNLLIEYDGTQHFDRGNNFFSEEYVIRDFTKNMWIQNQKHYSFLRIPPNLNEDDINIIVKAIIDKKVTSKLIKKYKLYAYNRKNQVLYNSYDYYTNINENYFVENKELLKEILNKLN